MIIDFHTHVFPDKIAERTISILENACKDKAYANGTVNGLLSQMEKSGTDICINLPVLTKPSQFESVTEFACLINERFSKEDKKIISFAGMHPYLDDIKGKMKLLKEKGFLGVKIHPDYQNAYIDDDGYIEILKCAKELNMIVVTHSGVDNGYLNEPVKCTPDRVKKVINKVNHEKFVLAHFGAHKMLDEVYDKLCGLNVYFDTSFTFHEIDGNTFNKIVFKHGEDKILFATDCPWQDIENNVKTIKSYNLNSDTLEKILYKNALKLLKSAE